MHDPHTFRAMAGAALAPLSKEQKKSLILLARRAYDRLFANADFDARALAVPSFEDWRHQQQIMVVECSSLCSCRNEDFLFLKAHYLNLLGQKHLAEHAGIRAQGEPRQWALAKLKKECMAAGDVLPGAWNYADGFLRHARHVSIDEASPKQLWHAIYIVRRRAGQLRRKAEYLAEDAEVTENRRIT